MYILVGQAAEVMGVSISTLRRWEDEESFKPDFRAKGLNKSKVPMTASGIFLRKVSNQNKLTKFLTLG